MPRNLLVVSLFAFCATAAGLAAPAGAAEPPLIPRSVLFGNPERAQARVSPGGTHISFLAPVDGVLNVWVAPVGGMGEARPVTRDTGRGIRMHRWSYTGEHLLYVQDRDGDENWRIYAVNVKSDEVRDLTPFDNVNARIQEVSEKHPDEILVALNDRVPQLHDIHRVNIRTGERTLVQANEGYVGFMTDHDYEVRLAVRFNIDGSLALLKADRGENGERTFTQWQTIGNEDAMTTSPLDFDASGKIMYLRDSRGRDTAALFALDLESGDRTLVAEHAKADLAAVLMHPTERTPQAASFNYERVQWKVLDEDIVPDLEYLETVADGEFQITSRTLDDRLWTVAYILDNGPVRAYLYHRDEENRRAEFLFSTQPALEELPLARMRPVIIRSRDGLELVSYLTLPPGSGNGERPERALPMVLSVHGGPWARDTWGYDPYTQWLANRGYAVLSVNFRGSTGFGKAFINAGNREWAGKMHNDLLDAVEWAVEAGIADREKVAIMGVSYGGYATLVGLTFTPDIFACGVSVVGPSSLVTLMENVPPYWIPIMPQLTTRVGDHRTPEGREFLESRSPLNFVERIERPLLIGQGANDPRVKQLESDQIVEAMQERNIPVVYVLFPDEGHGFARPENRMAFNAVTEIFLAEHLGGRHEPIGDDFKGSTIQVPAGLDAMPGVARALKVEDR
jgi:dipeptidyl aminopeptidase/acylaminoacyl peptidase